MLLSDLAELPYQEPLSEDKKESLLDIFYDDLACVDCHDIDSEGEDQHQILLVMARENG